MSLVSSIVPFLSDRPASIIADYLKGSVDVSSSLQAIGKVFADAKVTQAITGAEQLLLKDRLDQGYEHHALHVYLTTITKAVLSRADRSSRLPWIDFLRKCQGRSLYYPDSQVFDLELRREISLYQKPDPEIEIETLQLDAEDFHDDFEDLLEIDQQCFPGLNDHSDNLFQRINVSQTLVARDKETGSVLGYLMYESKKKGENLYIHALGRVAEAAKLQIGEKLFQKFKREEAFQKCQSISLHVRESNKSAIDLYTRMGFIASGIEERYCACPEEKGLIMVLNK